MEITLPRRSGYRLPETAQFLVRSTVEAHLLNLGLSAEHFRLLPRGVRFRPVPNADPAHFTRKGYRRQLHGQRLYSPYQNFLTSWGRTRAINGACWHAHRDLYRAILTTLPSATIRTALATYRGLDDFEATHRRVPPSGLNTRALYHCRCSEA